MSSDSSGDLMGKLGEVCGHPIPIECYPTLVGITVASRYYEVITNRSKLVLKRTIHIGSEESG